MDRLLRISILIRIDVVDPTQNWPETLESVGRRLQQYPPEMLWTLSENLSPTQQSLVGRELLLTQVWLRLLAFECSHIGESVDSVVEYKAELYEIFLALIESADERARLERLFLSLVAGTMERPVQLLAEA